MIINFVYFGSIVVWVDLKQNFALSLVANIKALQCIENYGQYGTER